MSPARIGWPVSGEAGVWLLAPAEDVLGDRLSQDDCSLRSTTLMPDPAAATRQGIGGRLDRPPAAIARPCQTASEPGALMLEAVGRPPTTPWRAPLASANTASTSSEGSPAPSGTSVAAVPGARADRHPALWPSAVGAPGWQKNCLEVGALEAHDRLLLVADHEQRPRRPSGAPSPLKNSAESASTMAHWAGLVSWPSSTRRWSICWSSLYWTQAAAPSRASRCARWPRSGRRSRAPPGCRLRCGIDRQDGRPDRQQGGATLGDRHRFFPVQPGEGHDRSPARRRSTSSASAQAGDASAGCLVIS